LQSISAAVASSDQAIDPLAATEMATVHGSASLTHMVVGHASSLASTNIAVLPPMPVPGLVFQFSTMSLVNALASGGPHPVDQWLLAAVRAQLIANDPMLSSIVKGTFERVLATHMLVSVADDLDRLNWNGLQDDLDWQMTSDSSRIGGQGPGTGTDRQRTQRASVLQVDAEQAALDRYFAQMADVMGQTLADD
jgi:hypothetical protein